MKAKVVNITKIPRRRVPLSDMPQCHPPSHGYFRGLRKQGTSRLSTLLPDCRRVGIVFSRVGMRYLADVVMVDLTCVSMVDSELTFLGMLQQRQLISRRNLMSLAPTVTFFFFFGLWRSLGLCIFFEINFFC